MEWRLAVGGGPAEFTVEVREIRPGGTFRHRRAARPDADPAARQLTVGGAEVAVRADEVLDLAAVRQIFGAFLRGRARPGPIVWRDVTAMFAGTV